MERRSFLTGAAAAVAGVTAGGLAQTAGQGAAGQGVAGQKPLSQMFDTASSGNDAASLPRAASAGTLRGEMLYRPLGRTGVEVSAIGLGGSHVGNWKLPDAESIRLIHQALDRGITFLDNSWDYNEGRSERLVGQALSEGWYRQKAFVMTKIDGRTKEAAQKQIDTSLERLRVDHIDLLQHHEVIRFDDPNRIFAEGGSMEAVVAAQKAGKVRFIGFTGHKDPHIHLYMLDVAKQHGFHFDTSQMPLNVMDAHYRSFARLAVPRMIEEGIGVLGMKSIGDGVILKSNTVQPVECIHYALNLPTSVVICGIDSQQILDQAFAAAKSFKMMNEQQVAALIGKTQQVAMTGQYELFKTTAHFDSTAKHPEYLGDETPETQKLVASKA